MEWLRRLVELVRDDAGKREAGREDRITDTRSITDDHRDGDRLADGPAEAEKDRGDQAGPAKGITTRRMTSQRVPPRASTASRCRRGVVAKTSRVTAATMGMIIRATIKPATK